MSERPVMRLYPIPGACPECGDPLKPVLVDWSDRDSPTGLSGGWRWKCGPCSAPRHVTEWSESVRRVRREREVALHELAPLVGCTTPQLSAIEHGYVEPTEERRAALTAWLKEQESRND